MLKICSCFNFSAVIVFQKERKKNSTSCSPTFHLSSTYFFKVSCVDSHQPAQEEHKETVATKKEPEAVEEGKEEDVEKKEEEPAEQEKEVKKGEETATEVAKKEKPAKEKKAENKTEEAKGPKRQKTMQCKVTLLDDTQFECELDVRGLPDLCMFPCVSLCYMSLQLNTCLPLCLCLSFRNMLKARSL